MIIEILGYFWKIFVLIIWVGAAIKLIVYSQDYIYWVVHIAIGVAMIALFIAIMLYAGNHNLGIY